jgi:hypothetical protein
MEIPFWSVAPETLGAVALGTTFASTAIPSDPALADGLVPLGTLLVVQVAAGLLRQWVPAVRRLTDVVLEASGAFSVLRATDREAVGRPWAHLAVAGG